VKGKEKQVRRDRVSRLHTPISVPAATVVLFMYLVLARADSLGAGGSIFRAVFDYGLPANALGAVMLRSILVYLAALSVVWPVVRFATPESR
jgi:hypothetical protein